MNILNLKRDEVIDGLKKHLDPEIFRSALGWSTPQLKATLTLYESGEKFEKPEKVSKRFIGIDMAAEDIESVTVVAIERYDEEIGMRGSQKRMFFDRLFKNVIFKKNG